MYKTLSTMLCVALAACAVEETSEGLGQSTAAINQGPLDSTFNGSGRAYGFGNHTSVSDFVIREDALVAVGTYVTYIPLHLPNGLDLQLPVPSGMLISRMTSDGTPDKTFLFGGGFYVVVPPAPGSTATGVARNQSATAILDDGSGVVVGGSSDGRFALVRVKHNGATDTAWGRSGGATFTEFAGATSGIVRDLGRDSQGRIVAVGTAIVGTEYRIALARYTADGQPDRSFNATGTMLWNVPGAPKAIGNVSLALEGDQPVIAFHTSEQRNFLARFTTSGRLDTSFGDHLPSEPSLGYDEIGDAGDATVVNAVLVRTFRNDRDIYVTGNDATHRVALWAFSANGVVDTQFGPRNDPDTGRGVVSTNFAGDDETMTAMTFDPVLQRLYLAGSSNDNYIVAAYLTNGALDTSFNGSGKARTDLLTSTSEHAVALVADRERLIVAGDAWHNDILRGAYVRYVLYTGQEGEPCRGGTECDGALKCSEAAPLQGHYTICTGPGTPTGAPIVTPAPGKCAGYGEACSEQPSECDGDFMATGTIECESGKPVCIVRNGRDYCSVAGGDCGQGLGQPCGADNLCMPGLLCAGLPGQLRCIDACTTPSCWQVGKVGTCDAMPGCAPTSEVCNDIDDDCDGKVDNHLPAGSDCPTATKDEE